MRRFLLGLLLASTLLAGCTQPPKPEPTPDDGAGKPPVVIYDER